jgi:hypothetical protein
MSVPQGHQAALVQAPFVQAQAIAAAYAGTDTGLSALLPAARRLRRALPESPLLLLWPSALHVPGRIDALFERRVLYPTPPTAAALEAAIEAVAAEACQCLIVFTETGWSAHVPAYIGYLAGIERRAGIAGEFGGAVLSDPVMPPSISLAEDERHAFLLDAVGFEHETRLPEHLARAAVAAGSAAGGRFPCGR